MTGANTPNNTRTGRMDAWAIEEKWVPGLQDAPFRGCRTVPSFEAALKKLLELGHCEAGVSDDTSERVGVNRVCAWDRENSTAVGHDDVLALTHDLEAGSLERTNSALVIDAEYAGQT